MRNENVKTSIVVLSHGSDVAGVNDGIFKIAKMMKLENKWDSVEAGFLKLAKPNLDEVVEKVISEGAKRIAIIPLLLFSSSHVEGDIPIEIEKQKDKYPDVEFLYAKSLGPDERIAQIATDRINDVLRENSNGSSYGTGELGNAYIDNPDSIANESFSTIDKLLEIIGTEGIPEINLPVIKRIIHTTGDPEFGKSFVIFPGAVEAGITALREGKPIVTDVNMVKAGINKKLVRNLGSKVVCKVADRSVAAKAKRSGKTRAITAIDESIAEIEGSVVAIGNAPSALFHIVDLVEKGKVLPELIIGVPVGFVGAAESKEVLRRLKIPYITNVGRKGGSAIAVTIVNAILNLAKEGVVQIETR